MSDDQQEATDKIGGQGGGAFKRDLHSTPMSAWVTVGVLVLGTALVGVGLLMFTISHVLAWTLVAVGLGIGGIGLIMGRGFHLMSNTS